MTTTSTQLPLFDLTLFDTRCPKCGHHFNVLEDTRPTPEQEQRIAAILNHPRIRRLPRPLWLFLKTSPREFLLGYAVGVSLWETANLYSRATAYRHLRKLVDYQLVKAVPITANRHHYYFAFQPQKKKQNETAFLAHPC